MAHVSEDYGAAPPHAAGVRAHEGPATAPRPARPTAAAGKPRTPTACANALREKIGALCPPRLKPLPA